MHCAVIVLALAVVVGQVSIYVTFGPLGTQVSLNRLQRNLGGLHLLHEAAGGREPEVVQALLDGGAYVNAKSKSHGSTPLEHAYDRDAIDVLLAAGAVCAEGSVFDPTEYECVPAEFFGRELGD